MTYSEMKGRMGSPICGHLSIFTTPFSLLVNKQYFDVDAND